MGTVGLAGGGGGGACCIAAAATLAAGEPGAIPTPTLRLKLGATQEKPIAFNFSTRSSVSCDFKPRNRKEYSLRCFMTHRPKALSAG